MSMTEFLRDMHTGGEPRFLYHRDGVYPATHEIFVFGSNLAGRHGAGAALHAKRYRDAQIGVGHGLTGRCYALPTKDEQLRTLPLDVIRQYVERFIVFAGARPLARFFVTRVGCGLAGYTDEQIAPMFIYAPRNCSFAREWKPYLEK